MGRWAEIPGSLVLVILMALGACGDGGEVSVADYVERLDAVFDDAIGQYEALITSPQGGVLIAGQGVHLGFEDGDADLTDFTPGDLQVAMERLAEIQADAVTAAAAIEPPKQLAEFHELYFRELPIAELAARAGTAADWEELSESTEMAAYRSALAADNKVCAEFQARLDSTANQGVFSSTPWLPAELERIADDALGCGNMPANPEDVFRPPAAAGG